MIKFIIKSFSDQFSGLITEIGKQKVPKERQKKCILLRMKNRTLGMKEEEGRSPVEQSLISFIKKINIMMQFDKRY